MLYSLDDIMERAAKFLLTIFDLHVTSFEEKASIFLKQRSEKSWNLTRSSSGSSTRAMLFSFNSLESSFASFCQTNGMLAELMKKRKQFPHEFTLFTDPDGCEAVFSWGLRCSDQDRVQLYPSTRWQTYLDTDLSVRLNKGLRCTSNKLDSETVSGAPCDAKRESPLMASASRSPSPPDPRQPAYIPGLRDGLRYSPPRGFVSQDYLSALMEEQLYLSPTKAQGLPHGLPRSLPLLNDPPLSIMA